MTMSSVLVQTEIMILETAFIAITNLLLGSLSIILIECVTQAKVVSLEDNISHRDTFQRPRHVHSEM